MAGTNQFNSLAGNGSLLNTESGIAPNASRQRIQYIDVARGIAIISIILGHSGVIYKTVYTFDIPIFFMITGFFIDENDSFLHFIKRKFQTLIVPYYIVCTIVILFAMLIGFFTAGDPLTPGKKWLEAALYGSGSSWISPFLIIGIGPVWFLWAAFFSAIIVRLLLNTNYVLRILTVVSVFVTGYLTSSSVWLPLSLQAGLCSVLYVYLGYLLNKEKHLINKLNIETKIICILILMAVWISFILSFEGFWFVTCDFGKGPIDIFSSICACLSVLVISYFIDRYLGKVSGILSFIGKNSIFILCIHAIEFDLLPGRFLLGQLLPSLNSKMLTLVFVLCEITVDITLALTLSRIRIVRKAFGLKK